MGLTADISSLFQGSTSMELQKQFIKRSAKLVENTVTKTMKAELTQLREDVIKARDNQFGRKLFEAFVNSENQSAES